MGFSLVISASSVALLLASAQEKPKTYTLEDALQICARVQNSTDRLACFEGLAKSSAPDAKKGSEATTGGASDAPAVASTAQSSDEQRRPRFVIMRAEDYKNEKHKGAVESNPTRKVYEATVLHAWKYGISDYYIVLTNGEIWKNEAHDKGRPVKDGEKVELNPGAVGSWFMQFKTLKRPTIRVSLVK